MTLVMKKVLRFRVLDSSKDASGQSIDLVAPGVEEKTYG